MHMEMNESTVIVTFALNNFQSLTVQENYNRIKLIHGIPESRKFVKDCFILLKMWAIGINLCDKFGQLQKVPRKVHTQLIMNLVSKLGV